MSESLRTRVERFGFNFFPAYRHTGGRITYIARDWREVRVELPLRRATRNYVGTLFGGSMYGAVDPIYMMMLIRCLGSEYVVWDKRASITFKKPGRSTLYARFTLDEAELHMFRGALQTARSVDRTYTVDLVDREGVIHATVEKVLYVRAREARPAVAQDQPVPVAASES
jgi:acyl-coenzyme A thioesterase PaaI-like protein